MNSRVEIVVVVVYVIGKKALAEVTGKMICSAHTVDLDPAVVGVVADVVVAADVVAAADVVVVAAAVGIVDVDVGADVGVVGRRGEEI